MGAEGGHKVLTSMYKLGNICVAVNSWEKRFEKRYQAALKVVITEEDIFEAYL